jgi:hypothetical protein
VTYPGERVQIEIMVRGFGSAKERYDTASELPSPEPAYFALFESLNWAVAIDDVIGETWRPDGGRLRWGWRTRVEGADVLIGVRFARNLAHHHWARALRFETVGGRPRWVWPPASILPPPRPSDEWAVPFYDELMVGERVADTMHSVGAIFATVQALLVPPGRSHG